MMTASSAAHGLDARAAGGPGGLTGGGMAADSRRVSAASRSAYF